MRMPPQRINMARIRCSHFVDILFLRKADTRPPTVLPIRNGKAPAQGIAAPKENRETMQIGSMMEREVGNRTESSS